MSYYFSKNWFMAHKQLWSELLLPLADKPLKYLEVGTFEGASLFWVVDNVLKHPDSRATCIDTGYQPAFWSNLRQCEARERVTSLVGESRYVLRGPLREQDIIYIDGNHDAKSVFIDIALSWDLLKVGGLLILDDYLLGEDLQLPLDMHPEMPCDVFMAAFGEELDVLHSGYQLIVRKKESQRKGQPYVQVGDVKYWFYERMATKDGAMVECDVDDLVDQMSAMEFSYK